jgi:hypothetical protein
VGVAVFEFVAVGLNHLLLQHRFLSFSHVACKVEGVLILLELQSGIFKREIVR